MWIPLEMFFVRKLNYAIFIYYITFPLFSHFRPPNPIEYLASYLLKNKHQFDPTPVPENGNQPSSGGVS